MGRKVLFVDDQIDFLRLLKVKLKDEAYEKFYIYKSEEVLECVEKEDIDVVISDMNMPKSGIELFKELGEKHPEVVKIALSGSLNTSVLLMAINEGNVYKYIPKPWKVDDAGKKIIRDAIDFSKVMKSKNKELVSIKKLKYIFEKEKLNFKIEEVEEKEEVEVKESDLWETEVEVEVEEEIEEIKEEEGYVLNEKYLLKVDRG